jgi:hypothetical protein
MARKELAGLAALGALAMMANKSKKEVPDMRGGAEDERPAPTGMGEATQLLPSNFNRNEDYGNESNRPIRAPVSLTPRPRPRPTAAAPATAPAAVSTDAQKQYDEANARAKTPEGRAERAKMEEAQGLVPIRPEEALVGGGGFSGLKTVAAMARGLANRKGAAKLSEYITPEIGMSRPMLPKPGQTYGEGFVMNRKKGGEIKMAKGGMARSSASSRGDGIASRGKTRGRMR